MILFIATILSSIYNVLIILISNTLLKSKNINNNEKNTVSIIISARNESDKLTDLIISLMNQTYPNNFYEVIVVNDRSTDNTHKILSELSKEYTNLKYINHISIPIDWAPKKWAINQAIENSFGDFIIQTDADCTVTSKWVETIMLEYSDKDVGFVCGLSPITSKNKQLNDFFLIDSIAQDAFAASCINLNMALTCTGRNISYRKQAFYKAKGFENISHIISGDDDLLLHKINNLTNYKTAFSLNTNSIVKSESPNSLDQFIRQRLRWSSKAFNYYFLDSSLELKLMLPFIYLVNIFCVFSIIKFINTPLLIGLLPWIIKSIADGIIIHRMMTLYKYKFSKIHFFILSLLHPIYISIFGIIGPLNKNIKWKE